MCVSYMHKCKVYIIYTHLYVLNCHKSMSVRFGNLRQPRLHWPCTIKSHLYHHLIWLLRITWEL